MKNIFVAATIACLLTLSSCSNALSSILSGTWSYNGISYNALSAIGSTTASTLTATTASTTEIDNVVFRFTSFPPAPGAYTVTNNPSPAAGQVYIITTIGTKGFTIESGASATATVTPSGSYINVSVPTVTFTNVTAQATASGPFTASITQNR